MKAIFKPIRHDLDYETPLETHYLHECDQHRAEIAFFHLDRLVGFRRVAPTAGRVFSLKEDLEDRFDAAVNATALTAKLCDQCTATFCIKATPGCADGKVEGSLQIVLPSDGAASWVPLTYPYAGGTKKPHKWENDHHYCERDVKTLSEYKQGRHILDLMDTAVLDFLADNNDRQYPYAYFKNLGSASFVMHLDNGRAFIRAQTDESACLYSITQCCLLRASTYGLLRHFDGGPVTLGQTLKMSLQTDAVRPVLADKHFSAVDRRVRMVLAIMDECVRVKGNSTLVLIADDF